MTDALLDVEDLTTHFFTRGGVVKAVDGVSLRLRERERLAVVGESGSGKSVMSMSLMRLVGYPGRIVGGRVRFDGKEMLALRTRELNRVRGGPMSMIFQDPMSALNPVLTIERQMVAPIRRHLGLGREAARARAIELLGQVGIPAAAERLGQFPHQLSGGMRQRVLIAMALSCNPKLLIADEPTTALDVTIQAGIIALLRRLSADLGLAVIFVTHDLGLVARFAQRVAVMYAGRIVEHGPTVEIFAAPKHPYTQGLLGSIPSLTGPKPDQLTQIPGAPPRLVDLPPGCPFQPRCGLATIRCGQERPTLAPIGPAHEVACWVALDSAKPQEAIGATLPV